MLVVSAFFLAWVALRPLRAEDLEDADTDRAEPALEPDSPDPRLRQATQASCRSALRRPFRNASSCWPNSDASAGRHRLVWPSPAHSAWGRIDLDRCGSIVLLIQSVGSV